MRAPAKFITAVRRRIIRRADIVVFRSSGPLRDGPPLVDLTLVRMSTARGIELELVETIMRRAGEVDVDVPARFARGDEFFALQGPDGIVAFRWVNFGADRAGHARLLASPHRAFLYNAFTLEEHRGRGLTHVLMMHTRKLLAEDGRTDLVCGASSTNTSSLRSKRKGGLSEVALVRELVVFHRFHVPLPLIIHEPGARELFFDESALDGRSD